MEKLKLFSLAIITSTILFVTSCSDDNNYSLGDYWISVVTINPIGNNSFYMTLDNGKTIWPQRAEGFRPEKVQRALVNYTILSDSINGYAHTALINRIDTFLTKEIAPNLGIDNDEIYGTDPVGIHDIWVGDGFLNIYFGTYWGGKRQHYVNLIPQDADGSRYELEFRHNAFDDPGITYDRSLVAFDLSDLPDTNGDTLDLKIKVITFEGSKIYTVKYNSNKKVYGSPDNIRATTIDNSIKNFN